ncbi:MAG: indole-3-glycerol phosphate synthase TrpC [Acidobacteriota bacterium]
MADSILSKIVEIRRRRLETSKKRTPLTEEGVLAELSARGHTQRSLSDAINRSGRVNVIAEMKKASPSKGLLRDPYDPVEIAMDYDGSGAAALSILTEEDHFLGSLDHLRMVRRICSRPILRKDFIVDPYQVWEAAAAGADAILLIVAILTPQQLRDLMASAQRLGLETLIEVHNLDELKVALDSDATIIGINNRDLRTFKVDLQTSLNLSPHVPEAVTLVSESGIVTADDIRVLSEAGCDAFLVGEAFMKSPKPGRALRELLIRGLDITTHPRG